MGYKFRYKYNKRRMDKFIKVMIKKKYFIIKNIKWIELIRDINFYKNHL